MILTGGIDLSSGSLAALAAVVACLLIRSQGAENAPVSALFIACGAAVLLCGLVGVVSGSIVAMLRIPPFIVTLAMMQVASGIAYIVSHGGAIYQIPRSFVWLGRGTSFAGIPNGVLVMPAIYACGQVLMSLTTTGRYIYAVGGNAEAARLSGVQVNRILILIYGLSAVTAGLGGVVLASQLQSGSPTYGTSYELYAIAAAVVGGISLSGGEGKIAGSLIGALIIGVIQNGMKLTNVES